jgi:hypothetical protein
MQTTTHHRTIRSATVERLSSFCRGEISAVEAYTQALHSERLARFSAHLRQCQSSHQTRVDLLRARIGLLGGDPPVSSGAWGAFARAMERAAMVAGEHAALAILEEGENHGLNVYRTELAELDAATKALVNQRLLPLQLRSSRMLSELKRQSAESGLDERAARQRQS